MVSLFSKTVAVAALIGASAAKDVACAVGGVQQSIVDLDTGSCSFDIPASQPVTWEYSSPEDYTAEFYYAVVDAVRYFTDITGAGRSIVIPARFLYGLGDFPLFQIFSEKNSPSNSTGALRKRFAAIPTLEQRDEESDLVAYLKTLDGTEISGLAFAVVDPAASSSETTGTGATSGATSGVTSTETNTATDVVTITSCSDNVCHETTVPAPTVTVESTTIVTITSCSENKCSKTAVPATLGETTATVGGEVTSYTTWCPLSDSDKTKYVTVTSCHEDKCHATVAPATHGWTTTEIEGVVTSYVTWCPVTETTATETAATGTAATEAAATTTGSASPGYVTLYLTASGGEVVTITTKAPTVAGESTVVTGATTVAGSSSAGQSSTAAVSTYEASGSFMGASLLSVLLMPLMALI